MVKAAITGSGTVAAAMTAVAPAAAKTTSGTKAALFSVEVALVAAKTVWGEAAALSSVAVTSMAAIIRVVQRRPCLFSVEVALVAAKTVWGEAVCYFGSSQDCDCAWRHQQPLQAVAQWRRPCQRMAQLRAWSVTQCLRL